jgi:hypothetical protein
MLNLLRILEAFKATELRKILGLTAASGDSNQF